MNFEAVAISVRTKNGTQSDEGAIVEKSFKFVDN